MSLVEGCKHLTPLITEVGKLSAQVIAIGCFTWLLSLAISGDEEQRKFMQESMKQQIELMQRQVELMDRQTDALDEISKAYTGR